MLKIGIAGKAGSGKNTSATMIAQDILNLTDQEYRIAAFASKIKETAMLLFPGCDADGLYGPSHLRQNKIDCKLNKFIDISPTFRKVTVDIGKLGRQYDSYFWVAHLANEFNSIQSSTKAFIISDIRFNEEIKWAKDNGFILLRIRRDDAICIDDISEHGQDLIPDDVFDIIINNNGSQDELKFKLSSWIMANHNNLAFS